MFWSIADLKKNKIKIEEKLQLLEIRVSFIQSLSFIKLYMYVSGKSVYYFVMKTFVKICFLCLGAHAQVRWYTVVCVRACVRTCVCL